MKTTLLLLSGLLVGAVLGVLGVRAVDGALLQWQERVCSEGEVPVRFVDADGTLAGGGACHPDGTPAAGRAAVTYHPLHLPDLDVEQAASDVVLELELEAARARLGDATRAEVVAEVLRHREATGHGSVASGP